MARPSTLTVRPNGATRLNGWIERSAELRRDGGSPRKLWFRVPEAEEHRLNESSDPFLIGSLFHAMEHANRIVVEGEISRELLRTLYDFTRAWALMIPLRYRPMDIEATRAVAPTVDPELDAALACFSGGMDSSFTVWRHMRGDLGPARRNIVAGIMMHGFDIPLEKEVEFENASAKAAETLVSAGLPLIRVKTNIREFCSQWEDAHGAALAACLHLLRNGVSEGLIAASHSYARIRLPWGSNPATDPLLATSAMGIRYDGSAHSRVDKAQVLAHWPEAVRNLRSCWVGPRYDSNCGKCFNCIISALCWAAAGVEIPPSLNIDDIKERIRSLPDKHWSDILRRGHYLVLINPAEERGPLHPGLKALDQKLRLIRRRRWRLYLRKLAANRWRRIKRLLSRNHPIQAA